jgi:hypothetical protein
MKPYSFMMYGDLHEMKPDPKRNRDKKKWYKPGKSFKKAEARGRKAKERQAIKKINLGDDTDVPRFKKTDVWNLN